MYTKNDPTIATDLHATWMRAGDLLRMHRPVVFAQFCEAMKSFVAIESPTEEDAELLDAQLKSITAVALRAVA